MRKSLAILLVAVLMMGAVDITNPFHWLKEYEVTYSKYFGPIRIYYDPQYAEFIDTKTTMADGKVFFRVMKIRLDSKVDETVEISFSKGPGRDMEFVISQGAYDGKNALKTISALSLTLPGDGSVLAAGHVNSYFNDHRKYVYSNHQLNEIAQPFKYVGLKAVTKRAFDIYSDKSLTTVVAHIPKDANIELLINEGDYYLVKSEFGLVGWYKADKSQVENPDIDGLYYNGD